MFNFNDFKPAKTGNSPPGQQFSPAAFDGYWGFKAAGFKDTGEEGSIFNVFYTEPAPYYSEGFLNLASMTGDPVQCAWTSDQMTDVGNGVNGGDYAGGFEREIPFDVLSFYIAPGTNENVTFLFRGYDKTGALRASQSEVVSASAPRFIELQGFVAITKFLITEDPASNPTIFPGEAARLDGIGIKNFGMQHIRMRSQFFPYKPPNLIS